jgi:RNA polymerase sigma factor (sigma-70 family)
VADDYDDEVAELQAIAGRDEEAFTRWFARHEIALKRSLRSFAAIADIEAIAQDTAIRVWTHASGITPDGRPGFLVRWAATVARNAARTEARRAGRALPHEAPPAAPGMPDPALKLRIQECRRRLPPTLRLVIDKILEDEGRHSYRELAAALDITFDAIRQNLTRARRALEKCLESRGIDVRGYLR